MVKISDYHPRAVGLPWVRKEDYAAFVRICEDGHDAPATWDIFNQRSEQTERGWKAQGQITVRAYIDPDTFPGWCSAHGKRVDSNGRAAYAASVAAEKHGRDDS